MYRLREPIVYGYMAFTIALHKVKRVGSSTYRLAKLSSSRRLEAMMQAVHIINGKMAALWCLRPEKQESVSLTHIAIMPAWTAFC